MILIGLILWLTFTAPTIGIILVVVGAVLFFVPAAPYGYSSFRGPRGPPL